MDIGELMLGLAAVALGASTLKKGVERIHRATQSSPTSVGRIGNMPPVLSQGRHVQTRSGPMRTTLHEVRSLDDRIAAIAKKANEGKTDPRVIAWARKELSQKCRGGWNGEQWCVPEKNTEAEIAALHKALRRDIRYTSDVVGVDTYAHPRRTLELGGGDCLPGETLLVTPQGLVRIDQIKVGDTIHDGASWVRVTNWWDKGHLPINTYELNNKSVLRCTADHRVFRVTRGNGEHIEVRAGDLEEGDLLLQPREFEAGVESLSDEHAIIAGAYLAEGWWDESKGIFCIAGVPNGKGVRELVLAAAARLGITNLYEHRRYIGFRKEHAWLTAGLGVGAAEKRLPHLNFDRNTIATIVRVMEMGDGGLSTTGKGEMRNMVYSTASRTLALQYRIMQRMLGRSTHMKSMTAEEHGGAGSLPIWRITVRNNHTRKPWAKVRTIRNAIIETQAFDIETTSGRIYLPESDVIVHNCDEYSATAAAALMSVGIPARFKVIRTKDSPTWNHIYVEAGTPKQSPTKWIALDASVAAKPGWEAPRSMVAESRVYPAY
jgi:transglutaminase-like putative cysteine protease